MAEAEHTSIGSNTNCHHSKDGSQVSSVSDTSFNQIAPKTLIQRHLNHHMPSDSQLKHVSHSCNPFTPFNGQCDDDRSSLASQDSGIPTLEVNPPEHIHARDTTAELVVPPAHNDNPATLNLDVSDNSLLKSSTFPRCDFDSVRLYGASGLCSGAGKGTLNRSDDISVCSVSSLSTEFSATLSVSNEDFLDFMVTSESSAVVTFENEDVMHRSGISLSPHTDLHNKLSSPQHQPVGLSIPHEARPKRLGPLASFFHRRKKDTDAPDSQREPGWKLFGKVPLKESSTKDHRKIQKEYERSGHTGNPTSPKKNGRKNLDFEPLSTTALILENRPANLPAKPEEEAQKHRREYEEMVAQAKRRELKEAQKRKKLLKDRCKVEETIGNAALTWNQEILPNWHSMCSTKRVRDLWWQGLPPSVRGKVWSLAIGNELNITDELYNICLARAKEKWNTFLAPPASTETECEDTGLSHADREASLELIKLDISRTFPNLCIFQQGGPYHDVLHSILGAYTCYRPDVGYVQGMSFIAAVLILNMDTADAFIAFANLLNKPCQIGFYRVDHSLMLTYFAAFEVFFEENLPKLFAHFKNNSLSSDIYLIDWIFTLYSKSLPLDIACRVWDVFCRDGEEFLFRTALGILLLYEDILAHMDFIHIAQFLTRLPESISADELFSSITNINMNCKNKKWTQVFQTLQKGQDRGSPLLKR
ncbi:TBC1 domain family member 14 isoform X1 [Xyrauchen texanus]|uniref:TBC1 domain family member 14 isoform X1 n=1 Tax=Xyrauchen texanus TaxID=154827 RepID=UPI002241BCAA|nr:TBC1 domain family member 14 isoform X1 [Xyrauchen texanus]XP_052007976.1 TBC1 domain family member 14 isoform X1 [Xyrauchen texanus]